MNADRHVLLEDERVDLVIHHYPVPATPAEAVGEKLGNLPLLLQVRFGTHPRPQCHTWPLSDASMATDEEADLVTARLVAQVLAQDWALRRRLRLPLHVPKLSPALVEPNVTVALQLRRLGLARLATYARYMTNVPQASEILDRAYELALTKSPVPLTPSPLKTLAGWARFPYTATLVPAGAPDKVTPVALSELLMDRLALLGDLLMTVAELQPRLRLLYWATVDEAEAFQTLFSARGDRSTPIGLEATELLARLAPYVDGPLGERQPTLLMVLALCGLDVALDLDAFDDATLVRQWLAATTFVNDRLLPEMAKD